MSLLILCYASVSAIICFAHELHSLNFVLKKTHIDAISVFMSLFFFPLHSVRFTAFSTFFGIIVLTISHQFLYSQDTVIQQTIYLDSTETGLPLCYTDYKQQVDGFS